MLYALNIFMLRPAHIRILLFIGVFCAGFAIAQDAPELFSPGQTVEALAGEKAELLYRVQWTGASDAWLVVPQQLPEVAGVELELDGVEVLQNEGVNVLTYRLSATSATAGTLSIPALNFHFQEGTTPLLMDETGQPLLPQNVMKSDPVTVRVREPLNLPSPWVLGLIVCAGGVVAALGLVAVLRRKKGTATSPKLSLDEQLQQLMHEARRFRLDGDFYAYYKSLCAVVERIGRLVEDGAALQARLQDRTQSVGFRGMKATDETMDADWREVERAMARYRESIS